MEDEDSWASPSIYPYEQVYWCHPCLDLTHSMRGKSSLVFKIAIYLEKSWILEKSQQQPLYQINIIPNYIPNICPYALRLCYLPWRKLLFATVRVHYRKPWIIKMQNCGALSQPVYLQHNPAPKAQGSLQKGEDRRITRVRETGSSLWDCFS